MHCSNCGANIPEGSKFCRECGAIAMDPTQALAQVAEATGAGETTSSASYDSLGADYRTPSTVPDQPEKKRGRLIALVAALFVMTLAIGGFFAARGCAPEPEPAVGTTKVSFSVNAKVSFSVNAEGYEEPGSRLRMQLTGTTAEGEAVSQTIYVTVNSTTVVETLELKDGTYTYEATGSPISANGVIYDCSDVQGAFTLSAGEGNEAVLPAIEAELAPIDPAKVTDEEIEAAYQSALADDECDNADELKEAAETLREEKAQEAKAAEEEAARKAAEEEAQRAAEEEAARKAAEEEAARKAAEEEAQRAAEEAAIEASSPLNTEWFYVDNVPAGWTMTVTPLSDTEWEINVDYGASDEPVGNKSIAWIKVSDGNGLPLSAGSVSLNGYMPDYRTIVGSSLGNDGLIYNVYMFNLSGVIFDTSGLAGSDLPTIVIKNPV